MNDIEILDAIFVGVVTAALWAFLLSPICN